jgi:hypothetical protein
MGVVRRLHASRLASQLAFMLIETIREEAGPCCEVRRGELGWVLDDNQGMKSIAQAIGSNVNRVYRIYQKEL